ncbi:MAG: hypothetical protein ACK5OB_06840 [Pirellula sp.]
MNALSESFAKLRVLVSELSPQNRWLAGLLVLAILVGAGCLVQSYAWQQSGMESLLQRDLTKEELDQFELVFHGAELSGHRRVGQRITVPSGTRDRYLQALQQARALPNRLGNELEEFGKGGNLLESSRITELRYRNLQIKSLQNTLRELPFVRDAVVTIDEKHEGFTAERKKTASVAIYPHDRVELTDHQKQSIIAYIQSSLSGLQSTDIALLDMSRGETTMGGRPRTATTDSYWKQKENYEKLLRGKVLERLAAYGDVHVAVDVPIEMIDGSTAGNAKPELIPTAKESSEPAVSAPAPSPSRKPQSYPNARDVVTLTMQTKSVPSSSSQPTPAPARLQSIDRPRSQPATVASQPARSSEAAQRVAVASPSTDARTSPQQRLPRSLGATFSISIPFSYYQRAFAHAWQLQHAGSKSPQPQPSADELDTMRRQTKTTIREMVAPLLGAYMPNEDIEARIIVTEYIDHPNAMATTPSTLWTVMAWAQESWKTLALLALAFFALNSLRGFVKGPAAELEAVASAGDGSEDLKPDFDGAEDAWDEADAMFDEDEEPEMPLRVHVEEVHPLERERASLAPGAVPKKPIQAVREEWTQLVQSNPTAAAGLLESWLKAS